MRHTPYPLEWPLGQPRTAPYRRASGSRFGGHGPGRLTVAKARDGLLTELHRLDAKNVVISTDVELRLDGLPRSGFREPVDPGAAVYFLRRGRSLSIACDRYDAVASNLRALALTVQAIRSIERHGSTQLLEQALSGFAALPAAIVVPRQWWEVLGLPQNADRDTAERAYRRKVMSCHPDRGGQPVDMAELNDAITRARKEAQG